MRDALVVVDEKSCFKPRESLRRGEKGAMNDRVGNTKRSGSLYPARSHYHSETAFRRPETTCYSTGLICGGGRSVVLSVQTAISSHRDAVALDHVRVEKLAFSRVCVPVLGFFFVYRVLGVGVGRAKTSEMRKKVSQVSS